MKPATIARADDWRGNDPVSSCEGKQALPDARTAERAARRRKGRVAYRCRHCGHWHVGSKVFRSAWAAR